MKEIYSTFEIQHNIGLEIMERLSVTLPRRKDSWMFEHVEITIMNNSVIIKRPGLELNVPSKTEGLAIVTFPVIYLRDEFNMNREIHKCKVIKDFVTIGNVQISAETKFTIADEFNTITDLPMNYTFVDILKMEHSNNTREDIWFKNFDKLLKEARKEKSDAIKLAYRGLKPFGFTRKQVVELIDNSLRENPEN